MGNPIDMTGQRFGRWLVVERGASKGGKRRWLCRCECGEIRAVDGSSLRKGLSKSCGCLHKEQLVIMSKLVNTKHGCTKTRLYNIWGSMKRRCLCTNNKDYPKYGGRGIAVCEEWQNSFEAFRDWALANGYDDKLSIDRINNNGNYEPSNCRWVSIKVQNRNRITNKVLTYYNQSHCVSEWAEILHISESKLRQRIEKLHWSIERAFNTP